MNVVIRWQETVRYESTVTLSDDDIRDWAGLNPSDEITPTTVAHYVESNSEAWFGQVGTDNAAFDAVLDRDVVDCEAIA